MNLIDNHAYSIDFPCNWFYNNSAAFIDFDFYWLLQGRINHQ